MTRNRTSRLFVGLGIAVAGLTAGPLSAQTLGMAPPHEISAWRVVGALLFCCLLGCAGALALKYRMQKGRPNIKPALNLRFLRDLLPSLQLTAKGEAATVRMQIVETVRLSNQVDVSLIECDGAPVMIVTSPHGAFVVNRDAPEHAGNKSAGIQS